MNAKIVEFLSQNKLLSWAMRDGEGVYCANAFYAFDEGSKSLVIASHEDTKHIKLAFLSPFVSVNVAKVSSLPTLKGIQIKAKFARASKAQEKLYYKRFAFAKIVGGACFALSIDYAKLTNNALGKKIEWERTENGHISHSQRGL